MVISTWLKYWIITKQNICEFYPFFTPVYDL